MRLLASLSLLVLIACGGSSGGGSTQDFTQVTILSTGFTSSNGSGNISIPTPGAVVFANNDSVSHQIVSSDPQCSALNTAAIAPGTSTAKLPLSNPSSTDKICPFSDSANASGAFQGTVTILTTPTCVGCH